MCVHTSYLYQIQIFPIFSLTFAINQQSKPGKHLLFQTKEGYVLVYELSEPPKHLDHPSLSDHRVNAIHHHNTNNTSSATQTSANMNGDNHSSDENNDMDVNW